MALNAICWFILVIVGVVEFCIGSQVNPPSYITVDNYGTTDRLAVSWVAPTGNVNSYTVYIEGDVSYSTKSSYTWAILQQLSPGREYTIYVETVSGVDKANSTPRTEATCPTPPGSLITKDIGNNSVLLKWDDPAGMSNVPKNFSIRLLDYNYNERQSVNVPAPTFQYSNLLAGYYIVKINTVGVRNYTSRTVYEYVYISGPVNVTSISVYNYGNTDQLDVWWDAPIGHVDYYTVYIKGDVSYQTNTTYTYVILPNLSPGREYTIYVETVSGAYRANSTAVTEATYPTPPGSLITKDIGNNSILLKWNDPADMSNVSKSFSIILLDDYYNELRSDNVPEPTFQYSNLPAGYYTITIYTVGALNYTSWTVVEWFYIPVIVTWIFVRNYEKKLDVSWNAPTGTVDYYLVYIEEDASNPMYAPSTSATLSRLSPGREYTIHVETVSGVERANSTAKTEATYPTAPLGPITNSTEKNIVLLKWNDPENMAGVPKRFNITLMDSYNTVLRSDIVSEPTIQYYNLSTGNYTVNINTVGACNYTSDTITGWFYVPYDPPVGAIVGGVIGGVVGFCLLGFSIYGILRFLKNRRKTSWITKPSESTSPGEENIELQYYTITDPTEQYQPPTSKRKSENSRDPAIPPPPTNVSINTSCFPGPNSDMEFIITEDPVPRTVVAFWTFIWENQITAIVMLSECNENFEVQGMKYWPLEGHRMYGNVLVETLPSQNDPLYWKVRTFTVTNINELGKLEVQQFHFGNLDQKGDRDNREVFIQFIKLVHQYRSGNSPGHPILVHCRNGVDRSGLFVALSRIITQLQGSVSVNVHEIIADIQRHQPAMIQTVAQYSYLCKCSEEHINFMKSPEYTNVDETPVVEAEVDNNYISV